jgi:hypothetical protein
MDLLEMPSMNVGKHPLGFPMKFSWGKNGILVKRIFGSFRTDVGMGGVNTKFALGKFKCWIKHIQDQVLVVNHFQDQVGILLSPS